MRVAIGGTFQIIHDGHKRLIDRAFEAGDHILIGLTSDEFARSIRKYDVKKYEIRKMNLENYISRFKKSYEIRKIEDHYGPTVEEDFDLIVVSHETKQYAYEINNIRISRKKKPLKIINIGRVLAEDFIPITSTRIINGLIDEKGKRMKNIKIGVGTGNDLKLKAVKDVFSRYFNNFEIIKKEVKLEIRQPLNLEDGIKCSYKRARESLDDNDYGIGIEATLIYSETIKKYFDVHVITLMDSLKNVNYSISRGFLYPDSFMMEFREEIGPDFDRYYGTDKIGKDKGAIGFLTDNGITRYDLIKESLEMTLLQKISPYYYL
ncbi:MAG: pantetheine-phosphate adenylyltransferase [Thermoplasmata archaeon]